MKFILDRHSCNFLNETHPKTKVSSCFAWKRKFVGLAEGQTLADFWVKVLHPKLGLKRVPIFSTPTDFDNASIWKSLQVVKGRGQFYPSSLFLAFDVKMMIGSWWRLGSGRWSGDSTSSGASALTTRGRRSTLSNFAGSVLIWLTKFFAKFPSKVSTLPDVASLLCLTDLLPELA